MSSCRSPSSSAYCPGLVADGDVRSAPARSAPEIPDRMERTPGTSSGVAAAAVLPVSAVLPDEAVLAVLSGVDGVASPDFPPGSGFPAGPAPAGGDAPGVVDGV